jgi:ribosomal protein L20
LKKGPNALTETTLHRSAYADYLDLLRQNRNFRSLWIGQIVSLLGDWFNLSPPPR